MAKSALDRRIAKELANSHKSEVVLTASKRLTKLRVTSDEFAPMDALKAQARSIRMKSLEDLPDLLGLFADNVQRRGGSVFFAGDGDEATQYIVKLAEAEAVSSVVKGKSMVTEEIELNHALEAAGMTVVETDLGEYILQIAGETPSHIVAPAMHRSKEDVGELFEEKLGLPYTSVADELNAAARAILREKFLAADMGITGCNTAIAEAGTVCLVENEGNGRLTSTAPRILVVVMGMERIVRNLEEASVILSVLARSATGQTLGTYINMVSGVPVGEVDGPEQFHVVIVDNGRTDILAGETAEILGCIRCGACLNVCPIFQTIGGHGYGTVYTGPIGSVVSPGLLGVEDWGELAHTSTLCGACEEVCPIGLEIPRMLQHIRTQTVAAGHSPGWLKVGMKAYASAASDPKKWSRAQGFAGLGAGLLRSEDGWLKSLPGPGRGWTQVRDFPPPQRKTFRQRWGERDHGTS